MSKGLDFNKGAAPFPLLLFLKLGWVGTVMVRTGANPEESVLILAAADVCYLPEFWQLSLLLCSLPKASVLPVSMDSFIYLFCNTEHLLWECRLGWDVALSCGAHS